LDLFVVMAGSLQLRLLPWTVLRLVKQWSISFVTKSVGMLMWAAVAAIGIVGQTCGADLVTNGGFETGSFAGWNVGSDQESPYTASFLYEGTNAQIVNSTCGQPAWFMRDNGTTAFGIGAEVTTTITTGHFITASL
jgi:hypothetical protein